MHVRRTHLPSPRPVQHTLTHTSLHNSFVSNRKRVTCLVADDDGLQETKLGPNVLAGIKELRENMQWTTATVMRNDGVALDGDQRLLHLVIDDHVDIMYGRKIQGKQTGPKWIDSYTVPGQSLSIRLTTSDSDPQPSASDGLGKLYTIVSSPYQSRRDSAYLDSSVIEIVASRRGDDLDKHLADLGPGSLLQVSQVVGRGFSSLFNSYVGLPSSLEEARPLLLIGVGLPGIAPLRAALNWTPLQAHASAHPVAAIYVTDSMSSAAFLTEWDQWRDAGVSFRPLYTQDAVQKSVDELATGAQVLDVILEHLLASGGVPGVVGGRASETTCLIAGVTGEVASGLSRALTRGGVARERILFCDYF